jgi:hypothetical protein
MEIDDDITDHAKMGDGYKRYMRLHAIVEEINSTGSTRSPEWYAEHAMLITEYDKHFKSGFSDVHPEITDPVFRANCQKLDFLINKLIREFDCYSWFCLYDYLIFNKILIMIIDMAHDAKDDDEFSDMFSGLSV